MDGARKLAGDLGIDDVFALRRVSDDQLVNLDGVGRGQGWAGNISIDPGREPLIARAISDRGLVRHDGPSTRIFGPYWTEHAAIVTVGDYVVVLGGPGLDAHDDEVLTEAAGELAFSTGEVSAEKLLADELELTKAALMVANLPRATMDEFLARLAEATGNALSCEFSAVVTRHPDRRVLVPSASWRPGESEFLTEALLRIVDATDSDTSTFVQDIRPEGADSEPLDFEHGLVSRCVIPLRGGDFEGAIVAGHTIEVPRGFSTLCRSVADRIQDQANLAIGAGFTASSAAPATDHARG